MLRLCASAGKRVLAVRLTGDQWSFSSRAVNDAAKDKKPLKKAKTPVGKFDSPGDKTTEVLEKFPDDVNPTTKEKGGPRGPEPTRYGDWERKGRCVDF